MLFPHALSAPSGPQDCRTHCSKSVNKEDRDSRLKIKLRLLLLPMSSFPGNSSRSLFLRRPHVHFNSSQNPKQKCRFSSFFVTPRAPEKCILFLGSARMHLTYVMLPTATTKFTVFEGWRSIPVEVEKVDCHQTTTYRIPRAEQPSLVQ